MDAMLGRVAKELRMLGYDARLAGREDDAEILSLAREESRTVLTRDRRLFERAGTTLAVFVDETDPRAETDWVLRRLGLDPAADGVEPLSVCLRCGTRLREAPPSEAAGRVPPYVAATQERFAVCDACGRVYWSGTHAERMLRRIEELTAGEVESEGTTARRQER